MTSVPFFSPNFCSAVSDFFFFLFLKAAKVKVKVDLIQAAAAGGQHSIRFTSGNQRTTPSRDTLGLQTVGLWRETFTLFTPKHSAVSRPEESDKVASNTGRAWSTLALSLKGQEEKEKKIRQTRKTVEQRQASCFPCFYFEMSGVKGRDLVRGSLLPLTGSNSLAPS